METKDLVEILDISKVYVSGILNYKKGLSKDVIRKLATHFKVSQEAFNRPYKLVVPGNSHLHASRYNYVSPFSKIKHPPPRIIKQRYPPVLMPKERHGYIRCHNYDFL